MDCLGTYVKLPSSDEGFKPLSSPLLAPFSVGGFQALSPLEGQAPFKPPSSLFEATFKPPFKPLQSSLHLRKASSPFKPPWSPLQAPLKPSEGEAPLGFKPPSSPLEARFKPPWSLWRWSPFQAPLKPPWSPLEAFRGWSPLRPSDLRPPPPRPQTLGLLKGVPRNQPRFGIRSTKLRTGKENQSTRIEAVRSCGQSIDRCKPVIHRVFIREKDRDWYLLFGDRETSLISNSSAITSCFRVEEGVGSNPALRVRGVSRSNCYRTVVAHQTASIQGGHAFKNGRAIMLPWSVRIYVNTLNLKWSHYFS